MVADVCPDPAETFDGFANGEHRRAPAIALVAEDRVAVIADPAVLGSPAADLARHVVPPAVVLLPRSTSHKPARAPVM